MANKIGDPVNIINPAGESYGGTGGKKVGKKIGAEMKHHKSATKSRGTVDFRTGKYEGKGEVDQPRGTRPKTAEGMKPRFRIPGSKSKKPTKTAGQVGVSRVKKSQYR